MEKDYQNNNSISDAANNNEESNKPEHEIKVEIVSIEVVGEDTPPKHSHHGICPKTFAPIYPHYKSFDSYIKPQPSAFHGKPPVSCISFDSYIKPQPQKRNIRHFRVVYLLIPTSNHNPDSHQVHGLPLYIF